MCRSPSTHPTSYCEVARAGRDDETEPIVPSTSQGLFILMITAFRILLFFFDFSPFLVTFAIHLSLSLSTSSACFTILFYTKSRRLANYYCTYIHFDSTTITLPNRG